MVLTIKGTAARRKMENKLDLKTELRTLKEVVRFHKPADYIFDHFDF